MHGHPGFLSTIFVFGNAVFSLFLLYFWDQNYKVPLSRTIFCKKINEPTAEHLDVAIEERAVVYSANNDEVRDLSTKHQTATFQAKNDRYFVKYYTL